MTGLLLDTHVLVWLYNAPERLPSAVRTAVGSSGNVSISAASAWEYEQKRRKNPAMVPFPELISASTFETLDFPFACYSYASSLPPIHADPFDRMLIAHTLLAGLTLVTRDEAIHRYPVDTLW